MSTRTMFATAAVAIGSSVTLLFGSVTGVANAEPAPPAPLPIDALQAPGLPAVQSLGPVIQAAAADPTSAASTLRAAAAVFAGDAAAPADSRNVASAVNQFVAHTPAPGAVPGTVAHLPAGINPAHAVGPVPEAAPAPEAVPAPGAAAAAAPAPGPAPEVAVPVPAPAPVPDPAAAAPAAAPGGPEFGPDAPTTQDFLYPSISNGCLKDGGNVLATAISVAGPAKIPTPGPGPGQTAYVFTAIGTPGPAAEQKLPLNVTWVNLTTGKSGGATLVPQSDINPQGPTTLTAIADTGSGSIISTIFGQVSTTEMQCQFMPTIGSTVVP
ncbi:MAG: Rv1157c family protein [Mycobacterium sp.]